MYNTLMLYEDFVFQSPSDRPFYFINFVSTIDGKIRVTNADGDKYWPIGSKLDYQTLIELRAYADVLIHGKNTASSHRTVDSLAKPEFRELRKNLGKSEDLVYIVLSDHPDEKLHRQLENSNNIKSRILKSDITELNQLLTKKEHKIVLVEGGPHVLGAFFKARLIDEVFLTLAPKIFGNEKNETLTMVEGFMFPADQVPTLELISTKSIENELFLRYKVNY